MQGKIVKGIAGFYYVSACDGIYECKAKGAFRKENRKPLVGDNVLLDVLSEEKKLGNITQLLPRRSELIRPAVANVDQALVIFSIASPQPNLNLLDRFLIMMRQQGLPCMICFNKVDLDARALGEQFQRIYQSCGYPVCLVSTREAVGIEKIREFLHGKTTTVAGPSGVGKSSLINMLTGDVVMETGDLSRKIDRGKHTTRHSELLVLDENTYILDTPGFSSLDLFHLEKEELAAFYPEFAFYEKNCKFTGCSHVTEPVCGVREALKQEKISRERYDNYCQLYSELKMRKKY